jgi:3-oxoacyl-(acyl-carrier-protein) synthase
MSTVMPQQKSGMSGSPSRRRVAVTGVGLVTPVGNDVATSWDALLAGRSGGGEISLFDASGFSVHIAAEVKNFTNTLVDDRKLLKFANRSHRFALEAAEQAMRDAGIRPTAEDAHRWGCAVGTGMMTADFDDLAETQAHSASGGELDVDLLLSDRPANDPLVFCRGQAAEGLALLTRRFGIHGYATSVHTACASGGQALGTALKLIRRGQVDRVLAGGFDSMISPIGMAGFCLLSALSADNATPERASRPFDATRNGFLLGEGAGFVVLEEWESARRRGARISAELAGDGNSLSSYRITDSPPDGDGPIQAMRQALDDAGAAPEDIDYINAHGTSTAMNDRSESAAIHAVFGDAAGRVSVSSTKSTMGHLIAAAGAVEGVVCALAIARGEMPINANYRHPDADCQLNLVLEAPRRQRIRTTLSNSFGFGGSNSCIVMRHPEEVDGLPGDPASTGSERT